MKDLDYSMLVAEAPMGIRIHPKYAVRLQIAPEGGDERDWSFPSLYAHTLDDLKTAISIIETARPDVVMCCDMWNGERWVALET